MGVLLSATPRAVPFRLKQVRAARKQLRDFNTASKHQLDSQLNNLEEAANLLTTLRSDLDYCFSRIRYACSNVFWLEAAAAEGWQTGMQLTASFKEVITVACSYGCDQHVAQ